jgi:hypothetical protein
VSLERAIYAYAVVPGRTRLGTTVAGLADAPVELLGDGPHALLVSRVLLDELSIVQDSSSDPLALADHAQRHDAVVRGAMDTVSAVVPFRMGTVLRDQAAARAYLADRREGLHQALQHVTMREEWSISIDQCPDDPAGNDESTSSERNEGVGAGAAYLARRRHQLATARSRRDERAQLLHDVADALRATSVDVAPAHKRRSSVVFAESYLVARDCAGEFFDAVDDCGDTMRAHSLALRLTGPWPPYSFVGSFLTEQAHD